MDKITENESLFANSSEENGKMTHDHTLRHAKHVADTTSKLLSQLGADEDEFGLAYVAALLHDIGCVHGKKGHAKAGAEMVEKYIQKFDLFDKEKQTIVNAVARHGKSEHAKELIDYCLVLADKCDWNKVRVVPGKYSHLAYLNTIKSNDINFKDGKLILEYEKSDNFNYNGFYAFPKSIDEPILIGQILEYPVEFYIDGVLEYFECRKDYTDFVYGK